MNRMLASVGITLSFAGLAQGQLTNTGFDTGFVLANGQAHVPAPWTSSGPGNAFVSFDTFDDSGSNGLAPGFAGLFPGVTAQSGNRWAGGWHFENMSQLMGSTLIPGGVYAVSAWVHAPNAPIGYVPGGWRFGLGANPSSSPTIVATFPATVTWGQGWVFQSATFIAPSNAGALPYFFPQCYQTGTLNTYMAIDSIDLRLVPAPGAMTLAGLAGVAALRRKR